MSKHKINFTILFFYTIISNASNQFTFLNNTYILKLDSLILNNHEREGIHYYNSLKGNINFNQQESAYIKYRYNKTVFHENFLNKDIFFEYDCEFTNIFVQDSLVYIFNKLNDYYSDNINKLTLYDIEVIENYINLNQNILPNKIIIQLLSELGRFYYHEGYTLPENSEIPLKKAYNLYTLNNEDLIYYDIVKNLCYLQIITRDNNMFLYYAHKYTKNTNNSKYKFDLSDSIIENYIKGLAFICDQSKDKGLKYYSNAFELSKNIKFSFIKQEVFKTYIGFRRWKIDTLTLASKMAEINQICANEGNLINIDRINAEDQFINNMTNSNTLNLLKKAYTFSINNKPFLKTQTISIISMLGLTLNNLGNYKESRNILISQLIDSFNINISNLDLFKNISSNYNKNKYQFITLNDISKSYYSEYKKKGDINLLFKADKLINIITTNLSNEFFTYDEYSKISFYIQFKDLLESLLNINTELYGISKNKKYALRYLYYLEYFKNILNRFQTNRSIINDKINNYNKIIHQYHIQQNFGDSLYIYKKLLDSTVKLSDNKNDISNYNMLHEITTTQSQFQDLLGKRIGSNEYINLYLNGNTIRFLKVSQNTFELKTILISSYFYDTISYIVSSQKNKTIDFKKYKMYSEYLLNRLTIPDLQNINIIISANNILADINFEALTHSSVNGFKAPYLIYKFNIKKCSNIFDEIEIDSVNWSKKSLGFFFSDRSSIIKSKSYEIVELPGNIEEAKVFGTIPNSKIHSGEDCNESIVKELTGDYNIIHFATHGYGSGIDLDSLFILFKNKDKIDSLYLFELIDVKWRSNLVILSSCEGRNGKLMHNNENFSFSNQLLSYKKANYVISANWKLNDKTTTTIINNFYNIILSEKSSSFYFALKSAKLKYLENNCCNKINPYYWAGLI